MGKSYGEIKLSRCKALRFYIEACFRRRGISRPVCGTSKFITIAARPLYTPDYSLLKRPPPILRLRTSDSATLRFITGGNANSFPIARRSISVAVRSRTGALLSQSAWVDGGRSAQLFLQDVGKKFDGATVFLRYAPVNCGRELGRELLGSTFGSRFATRLVVRSDEPSLLRQDDKLPVLLSPLKFPHTTRGKPVTLNIAARNPGNGKRAGMGAIGLSYQWFLKTEWRRGDRTFPIPISGATGPKLRIKQANCPLWLCDPSGCASTRYYSVRVCNSLGCITSEEILPNLVEQNGNRIECSTRGKFRETKL